MPKGTKAPKNMDAGSAMKTKMCDMACDHDDPAMKAMTKRMPPEKGK
jgi:hypothetical protein